MQDCLLTQQVVPLQLCCTYADSSAVLAGDNACFFNTAVQVLRATPGLVDKLRRVPGLSAEAEQDRPQRLAPAFLKLVNEVC